MNTQLGQIYPTNWEGTPEGMILDDLILWKAWRPAHAQKYQGFAFNVRVGGQGQAPPDVNETMRKTWRSITAKRIDVVGIKQDGIDIIELRHQAGPSAIGQLIVYRDAWIREAKESPQGPIKLILVTDAIDTDLLYAAQSADIEVQVI